MFPFVENGGFNAVQNNTSLKPQIQKSDRFFHYKARILFRITTP